MQKEEPIHHEQFSQITRNIKVVVVPEQMTQQAQSHPGEFAFAYPISIENLGSETVQLIDRHWRIFSADIQIDEVKGPGVVGYQPILKPGEKFQYTSGAVIHDPVGHMVGSYSFKDSVGNTFSVAIPQFTLISFITLH